MKKSIEHKMIKSQLRRTLRRLKDQRIGSDLQMILENTREVLFERLSKMKEVEIKEDK